VISEAEACLERNKSLSSRAVLLDKSLTG